MTSPNIPHNLLTHPRMFRISRPLPDNSDHMFQNILYSSVADIHTPSTGTQIIESQLIPLTVDLHLMSGGHCNIVKARIQIIIDFANISSDDMSYQE